MRRRGRRGPGLVRTAAVAGTAAAVGAHHQKGKDAEKGQQAYEQQAYEQQAYEQQAPPPPAQDDVATQIQQLGTLKDQGLLTEEEFAAKKKQILGI